MKIRIFQNMDDCVFRIVLNTEDWSQDDIKLMCQYGEPEIDMGGDFSYSYDESSKTRQLGHELVRVVHGFPFAIGFDSRDYGSHGEAIAVGNAWKAEIVRRISEAIAALRANTSVLPTEEVTEI